MFSKYDFNFYAPATIEIRDNQDRPGAVFYHPDQTPGSMRCSVKPVLAQRRIMLPVLGGISG